MKLQNSPVEVTYSFYSLTAYMKSKVLSRGYDEGKKYG